MKTSKNATFAVLLFFVGLVSDHHELGTALKTLSLFGLLAGLLFWIGAAYSNDDGQSVDEVDILVE